MVRIGSVIAVIALASSCATTSASKRAEESKAIEDKFITDAYAVPQIKALVDQKSSKETSVIMTGLVHRGMPQLENKELVDFARLNGLMYKRADVQTCGQLARKQATTEVIRSTLSTSEQREFYKITLAAASVESGARAPTKTPPLDATAIRKGMDELVKAMPPGDVPPFLSNLQGITQLPPETACKTMRTLYEYLDKAPEPSKSVVARAMTMS